MTTSTYRYTRHSRSLLHAHRLFLKKYPRRACTDAMLTFYESTVRTVCADLDIDSVNFNVEADPEYLSPVYPPTLAISQPARRLKGRTAYPARREHTGAYLRAPMRVHLWLPSYSAVSCGNAPLSII